MSNQTKEYTKGGQPVYRHDHPSDFQEPMSYDCSADEVVAHFEKYIGQVKTVFHEIVSDKVHIDVHCIFPTEERNYYTLFTTGMSDLPMTVPSGAEQFKYAELMICLPPNWDLAQENFSNEENYWPIRWLKVLAKLPHDYNTWLGYGHTIPNGDPPKAFANNTKLCCSMISTPTLANEEKGFRYITINPQKLVRIYALVPLYEDEMDFKLNHGPDELKDRMKALGINEILNINRDNACKKKKKFWIF